MSGFVFHPEALADLDEIWEYVAAENLDAADQVISDIEQAVRMLAGFPNTGHFRPDLTSRALRFHTVRDYLTGYAPEEKPLVVVSVLHGRRSPRVMAALLRGRESSD